MRVGATVRGINGLLMYEAWYQCERFRYEEAFGLLQRGEAVKIILDWE